MYEIIIPVVVVTVIGLICGIILTISSKIFYTNVNEEFDKIRSLLPNVNCGACGFPGCDSYAMAILKEHNTPINLCIPGGSEVSHKMGILLERDTLDVKEKKAFVKCLGNSRIASTGINYNDIPTCFAASSFYSGTKACEYSCLGFGDCVKVCKFDAIDIIDDLAVINPEKCVGCTLCVKECPRNIIEMIDQETKAIVSCSSKDKGREVVKVCKEGCIACGKCVKICPVDAIELIDNLACIDRDKCINCKKCVKECPMKTIRITYN